MWQFFFCLIYCLRHFLWGCFHCIWIIDRRTSYFTSTLSIWKCLLRTVDWRSRFYKLRRKRFCWRFLWRFLANINSFTTNVLLPGLNESGRDLNNVWECSFGVFINISLETCVDGFANLQLDESLLLKMNNFLPETDFFDVLLATMTMALLLAKCKDDFLIFDVARFVFSSSIDLKLVSWNLLVSLGCLVE